MDNPEISERAKRIGEMLKKSKPKAVVLITIEEPKPKLD